MPFSFLDRFFLVYEALSWENARLKCIDMGGDLASIGNKTDQELVKISFASANPDWWWWVGYNDKETEGNFVWSDGTQTSVVGWETGEPNGGSNENCVFIRLGTMSFFDFTCENTLFFICKLK